MIRHSFHIDRHDWQVTAFFEVSKEDAGEVLWHLRRVGASLDILRASAHNLANSGNNGMTYTSNLNRETLMIIGKASNGAEFFNTLLHEICHLGEQTSSALGIDPGSEEAAYFRGGVAREIYPHISRLLCECCRSKH